MFDRTFYKLSTKSDTLSLKKQISAFFLLVTEGTTQVSDSVNCYERMAGVDRMLKSKSSSSTTKIDQERKVN